MAPQNKDAKMEAGQKPQQSASKRPDIIGDVSVAVPNLTPEQKNQRQAGLLESKWATPIDKYQQQWESMLKSKTTLPVATSGSQYQSPTRKGNENQKPATAKHDPKGKAKETTQPSIPSTKLDADGGCKSSGQKTSSGKPLSIPPKPVKKIVGEGPSNNRHTQPVMSQQAKQTPPPSSANNSDHSNSNANAEAAKRRRRRGAKGKNKTDEAAPAKVLPQGQSTSQSIPAKGNTPKPESAASGGKDKQSSKPASSQPPASQKPASSKPISSQAPASQHQASQPPKTPSSTGAARNAVDSKLAQPASTHSPVQPKHQQQGGVGGNRQQQQQQVPQHQGTAAKGNSPTQLTKPANVPRVDETTGNDRKVTGTQANQQRPIVQARFGPSAPAGGASTTGVGERSMAVQQCTTGPISGFAITAQNAPVPFGWSPSTNGDVRARRSRGNMPPLASGWAGYQDRINATGAIQDIYHYAGDKLDIEKFRAYVEGSSQSPEAKLKVLMDMIITMDRVVTEKHSIGMSIQAERDTFRDDYKKAKAEADRYAEVIAAEETRREQQNQQIEHLRHSVAGLRKEVVTKESHIGSTEGELSRLELDFAESQRSLQHAVSKSAAQAAETSSQLEQIVSLQGEVETLSGELSDLRVKTALANKECKALKEEIANSPLQGENESLRSQLSEVRDQLASANQSLLDLEAERKVHACRQPGESGNPTSVTLSMELEGLGVGQDNRALSDEQDGLTSRPSLPASRASLYGGGNTVSMSTQTDEVEVIETSTQTEKVVVSQVEASAQTVSAKVLVASTQTECVGVLMKEASTQTALVGDVLSLAEAEARVAGVRRTVETRDAQVQTDVAVEVPGRKGGWREFLFALLLLTWAAVYLCGGLSDGHSWDGANDMSRTSVVGIRSQYVFPWSLMPEKLSFLVMQHFDRAIPG